MPHSTISSTGSDHGTVTMSSITSADYSLPELRHTRKNSRWNPRPAGTDYVINTSAIGRAFPNFSQAGSPDSTLSSGFSVDVGRAKLADINENNIRSPLTNIRSIDRENNTTNTTHSQSNILDALRNNPRPNSRNSTGSKRYKPFLQREQEADDSLKENVNPTTQTFTSQRSREEMQPYVADDSEFTLTRTKNSRFTSQTFFAAPAPPNVSSKRQPSEAFSSGTPSKPANAARVISQTVAHHVTPATNATQRSFLIPAATSEGITNTLNNGLPVIVEGGHVHMRTSSQAYVHPAAHGPIHSIAMPEEEEQIYLLIEVLKSRIGRIEAENEELRAFKAEHEKYAAQYDELKLSHETLKRSHEEFITQIKEMKESREYFEKQVQEMKESNDQLSNELRESNNQLDNYSQEIQEIRQSFKQMSIENQELKESSKEFDSHNQEIHELRESFKEVDSDNLKLKDFVKRLQAENDRLAGCYVGLENQHRHVKEQLSQSAAQQKGSSDREMDPEERQHQSKNAEKRVSSALSQRRVSESRNRLIEEVRQQKKNMQKPASSASNNQKISETQHIYSHNVKGARTVSHMSGHASGNKKHNAVVFSSGKEHPTLSIAARDVLDSLCGEHNAKNCMLCTRVTSFGKNTTGGAPILTTKPIPVSKRMPITGPYEDEPTTRPSIEPKQALATVIKGIEDEIEHLKMRQSEVQAQYQSLDASLGKRERRRIGGELESLLQQLEFKSDQLYGLYDALEGIQTQ